MLKIGTNRSEVEASQRGHHRVGFETHLEVTLPPGTRLKVQNEHGATEVADVAEAQGLGLVRRRSASSGSRERP